MAKHEPSTGTHAAILLTLLFAAACGTDGINTGGREDALIPGPDQCVVTIAMVEGEHVGTLQAHGDFTGVEGQLVTDGRFGRCSSRIASGEASLSIPTGCPEGDCTARPRLIVRTNRSFPLYAPAPLLDCLFSTSAEGSLDPDAFAFEPEDASTPDLQQILPPPVVAVSSINCSVPVSTTTSTVPSLCAGVECGPTQACLDGDCIPTDLFEVEISLTDDAVYGGIQFNAFYPREAGSFLGEGHEVRCSTNPEAIAYTSYNHDRSEELPSPVLRMAATSLQGIQAPLWLTRCLFRSTGGAVSGEIFTLEFVDATNTDIQPLDAHFEVTDVHAVIDE